MGDAGSWKRRAMALMTSAIGLAAAVPLTANPAPAATAAAPAATAAAPAATPAPAPASYRHGVVPPVTDATHDRPGIASAAPAASANLVYGGGNGGIGVTTGAPKVYLVFWGSQWGSQTLGANNNLTLSGDPEGVAPTLQSFFRGLGTGSETWSGVMT